MNSTVSLKNLAYVIGWLIADKFVSNTEDRNILCDAIGDRMTLLYEYDERKEKRVKREILQAFLNCGFTVIELSKYSGKSVDEISEILKG